MKTITLRRLLATAEFLHEPVAIVGTENGMEVRYGTYYPSLERPVVFGDAKRAYVPDIPEIDPLVRLVPEDHDDGG